MSSWLEIIIPARNAGSRLLETGASLSTQTERGFAVVLSDNFSSSGHEILAQFSDQMNAAGIPVRRVKPPYELGRVQHWNWAHAQAEAEWLKPLFIGDLLKPHYVERLRRRVEVRSRAQIVHCECEVHEMGSTRTTSAPFKEDSLTPSEFLTYYPAQGNWIGGPVNVAYRRTAWQSVGGYPPQLPACADLSLNAMLALRHGIEVIHEPLAVFQLHEQRFSHGIRDRKVNGEFEVWLILRQLRNYCLSVGKPWPEGGIRRAVISQLKINHWNPFKQRVKKWLGIKQS